MLGRLLIIAGSDSGGGAGIQADIKAATCLGAYAATAITALTAQNTRGVFGIHEVPDAFIAQQIDLVTGDIGVDAFKTGMLHNAGVIRTVAHAITPHLPHAPLVLDPVMFAKGGHALLQEDAVETLKGELIPLAALVTPNVPEAEFLADMTIRTVDDMEQAAHRILALGCKAVLVKGGHREGSEVTDLLLANGVATRYSQPRIDTQHTHGTGCTLASAIAAGLAQKLPLSHAVARARDYVRLAIENAPGIGQGHGPLYHMHTVKEFGV